MTDGPETGLPSALGNEAAFQWIVWIAISKYKIKIQDKEVTDSRKIADLLNDYFINNGRTLAENFTSTISILTCNINMTNTFRLQLIEGSTQC